MLPEGNFQTYKKKPKLADNEKVTLGVLAETLGVDSENNLFSKLKTEYSADFVNLAMTVSCPKSQTMKHLMISFGQV